MKMRVFVGAALLATASFAAAQQIAPQAPAAPPGADPDYATRRICRVTPANGSRLGGTRICHTKAEWDELRRDSRNTVDHIQRVTPPCLMGSNQPGHAHLSCSG